MPVTVVSFASTLRQSVKTSIFVILLFYFCKRKNTAQATKKLRDVYSEEALKDRQCRNWFDKFRSEDFSLKAAQRSGNRHVTVREIEKM